MMVPPLSERPVTDEDEEQFRAESAPRKYTLRQRWANHRAQARRNRPAGAKARVRAWMDADIVDWGIRTSITLLIIAGLYAIYTNGITNGWWPAWGDKPTTRPTPTAPATAPTEAAMSGGYQIGPDGVLVRPAEHAASTYTKPELPEEAKENTEEGAEAAARYYLALLIYAWNTGDTQPFAEMSAPTSGFATGYIKDIHERYAHGWTYGMESRITHLLLVEPLEANGTDIPEQTILVKYRIESFDGTICTNQNIHVSKKHYESTLTFIMTWSEGKWQELQGRIISDNE